MAYQDLTTPPKARLRTMQLIHIALFGGQVGLAFVMLTLTTPNKNFANSQANVLIYIVPFMAVACFAASLLIWRTLLAKAIAQPTLQQKMIAYQTALIVRFALLEGPYLFAMVCFSLTGNYVLLGIAGILIVYFIIIRPTRDKTETHLNLDYNEKSEFDE